MNSKTDLGAGCSKVCSGRVFHYTQITPARRVLRDRDPGSTLGNTSSQWRLWAGESVHIFPAQPPLPRWVPRGQSAPCPPRWTHYKVAATSIRDASGNNLCALFFLVVFYNYICHLVHQDIFIFYAEWTQGLRILMIICTAHFQQKWTLVKGGIYSLQSLCMHLLLQT